MKTTLTIILLAFFINGFSQLVQKITLPDPQKEGGMPLMEAMSKRQSSREYDSTKTISKQQISNILWAAYGFNRPNKKTVPSSYNQQEFTIYVALKSGLFIWDPAQNVLNQVEAGDYRSVTGRQDYVALSAMSLIYVADYAKLVKEKTEENKETTSHIHCGFISQNVYLCAASEGLNTCIRVSIDKAKLSQVLKLNATQHIIAAQSVGY